MIRTHWVGERIDYDGSQIRGGWARERFGIEGDSVVAFVGRCDVQPQHMVDLEDWAAGARIRSDEMLHLIVEHGDGDLVGAILRQRLLAAIAAEEIARRSGRWVDRRRSDLFAAGRKLNVSVATRTATSAKIHFGINVRAPADVGVLTAGIGEWEIDPRDLGCAMMERYADEETSLGRDAAKVRTVP